MPVRLGALSFPALKDGACRAPGHGRWGQNPDRHYWEAGGARLFRYTLASLAAELPEKFSRT